MKETKETFDDVVDDLGGLGKYQKRLLYFLLCQYHNMQTNLTG